MRFQVPLGAVKQFLERADVGQKGEDRFNQAALIPGALRAQFEVLRHTVFAAKAEVTQRDGLPFVLLDQGKKTVVAFVGRRPLPIHHTPVLIDDPAHFHADNPAPIAFAFLANLLRRTTFTHRVNEFNAVAIGHGKESGCAQKTIRPVPMRGQQSLQARALRQARKQLTKFASEPAMKVAKASALERKQRADSDNFARIKFGLRMLGDKLQAVINGAKEMCNNIFGFHESLREKGFGQQLFRGKALVRPMSSMALFIFQSLSN